MSTAPNAASSAAASAGAGAAANSESLKGSDLEVLDRTIEAPAADAGAAGGSEATDGAAGAPSGAADTKTVPEGDSPVNLAALEAADGPEWRAKITDAGALAEVDKLLALQKQFGPWFKDDADRNEFLAQLPGGRKQIGDLQTLAKEVTELDTRIAANTPESNAPVVARYLGEAPDKGVGLFRAAARYLAETVPDGWEILGTELLNNSLRAEGIGLPFSELKGTITALERAWASEDVNALGTLIPKLFGKPAAGIAEHPDVIKARREVEAANTRAQQAEQAVWKQQSESYVSAVEDSARQQVGTVLASLKDGKGKPFLSETVDQKDRAKLVNAVVGEIDAQLEANAYMKSQITLLVGHPGASKEDFAKALTIAKEATHGLVLAAIKKIAPQWTADIVAANAAARTAARGGPETTRKDVGGSAPPQGSKKVLSMDDLQGKKAKSDADILDSLI